MVVTDRFHCIRFSSIVWVTKQALINFATKNILLKMHVMSMESYSDLKFLSTMVPDHDQAPVPLSIFRSNSKFDENSKHSSVKYTRPITTIFCTRHDSVTVVTCAKYRCDRSSIFYTRVFWIFETTAFWIFIELCLVGQAPGRMFTAYRVLRLRQVLRV